MLDIFVHIYDTLFPPHKSVLAIKGETPEGFLRHYELHRVTDCTTLSSYSSRIVKAAVKANKFHDSKKAAALLASLLIYWLTTLPTKNTVLIPIPLSKKRRKERGYNQVERILETIPNVPICHTLLKIHDTKPQTSLARAERLENVVGAFVYHETNKLVSAERVVIVDDVLTTGATMYAAKQALVPHLPKNCEVICVALAH